MPRTLDSILRLEVPIIVRIGTRTMSVGEVANIAPGSIIELPKRADEQLDLLVSNIAVAQGEAVKVGENFGLGIDFIGDVRARIEALAGQAASGPESSDDGGVSDDEAAALAAQFLNG